MKLKEITFVFENCDQITIDGKNTGVFVADVIETSIERIACNAILKMQIPKTFIIEINKDANVMRNEFGCSDRKQPTFQRFIEWQDITQIEFALYDAYSDGPENPETETYHFWLDWEDNGIDEYTNINQKTYLSKNGHLYLVVSKDKTIEDVFDMEWIDDEEYCFSEWI